MKLKDLKAAEGRLSIIAALGVGLAIFSVAIYVGWIPASWIPPGDRVWPWLTSAVASGVYIVAVIARLCLGEKWK